MPTYIYLTIKKYILERVVSLNNVEVTKEDLVNILNIMDTKDLPYNTIVFNIVASKYINKEYDMESINYEMKKSNNIEIPYNYHMPKQKV